ncbi:VOC family protein [Amycolatopsis roodepoortensis]|uniref:VOC family protein n=1 Tax=Amycolatopsis roodepoortensis TaxID=700274 RepID=UPI00214C3FF1|nr:VOC family protein [Amycolatopsis roodepoortensis]UUV33498.1 VOC family protein [Amycolatopsis roodepoortensis]
MTVTLHSLSFAAHDPRRLARFWTGLLGPEIDDETGFQLSFVPSDEPKTRQNQMHFDLTSESLEDQERTVVRALELGGRHIDVGQRPEEGHVVLADPEGNEFCVIGPGNDFLADCGFVGAVACDGSQEVGYFWSEALGWPLVWDQDQETAIRSPHGGPKITWGGPPFTPKTGPNRLRFVLSGPLSEVGRLVDLGATRLGDRDGLVEMADPDGNEFSFVARA